ncbi:MAG TPA: subclass B3 metallo-beta-lactamase [Thermoanaerobaculia bacterium]
MKRLLVFLLLVFPLSVFPQSDPTSRSWNQPVEPFKIAGNLYYVGASDIASYLITTPEGHILIDSGFEETVPIIRENVRKLGFKLKDVKILLTSHAHYDHVGGLATLKELTGAKLLVHEKDIPQLARGGTGDPHLGDRFPFRPVRADRSLKDGEQVSLGGTTLTAHLTPGHTLGCTTWTMKAAGKDVVFVCSATILPGVTLTKNERYPGIAEDYARTFQVLKSLPCDIFLAAHANFYDGLGKAERLRKGAEKNPFIDPEGYKAYVEKAEKRYRELLEKEKPGSVSAPGHPQ